MTPQKRLSIVVAMVVVLGVAFVLIAPGKEESSSSKTASTAPAAQEPTSTPATTTSDAPTATAPAAAPRPAATRITVRDGAPVGGVQKVEVQQGDSVRLTITSDRPDEVHVHGYDLEEAVGPGAPARFSFTADADGVYEVELHESGNQIASLEVQPS
jgi:FtsP/CotA-like multicopper oxidase with cupredoxin domain